MLMPDDERAERLPDEQARYRSRDAQISAKIAQAFEGLDNSDLNNLVRLSKERSDIIDNIIMIARERASTVKVMIQLARDRENADAWQKIQWGVYSKILAIGVGLATIAGALIGIVAFYLQFFKGKSP